MNEVRTSSDGSLTPAEVEKVYENMLRLQELVDELYLCPCFEDVNFK